MPANPWTPRDGRASLCPVCTTRIPTGALRGHVGSARCMASVGRKGLPLTVAQRLLIAQGEAYGTAIRAAMREASS